MILGLPSTMMLPAFVFILFSLKNIYCRNGGGNVESRSELEVMQERAAKIALVAYDKAQMSYVEIDEE